MFEFKMSLNEEDFISFNKYHFINSVNGKKLLRIYRLFILFLSFLSFLFIWFSNFDTWIRMIIAIPIGSTLIVLMIFSKKMILSSIAKNISNLKKEGKLPYNVESICKFTEENIHEYNQNSETKTSYSQIEKIVVTDYAIYIYISSIQAFILPNSCFSSEDEKQRFRKFVNSKAIADR